MPVEFEKPTIQTKSKQNFQEDDRDSFIVKKLISWKIAKDEKQANVVMLAITVVSFLLTILIVIF